MSEIDLYLGDCLKILPTLETDNIDAVITDPPYGVDWIPRVNNRQKMNGDDKDFDPEPFLGIGEYHLFWGAHNYASNLPNKTRWLMWLKHNLGNSGKRTNAPFDLAWTDFGGGPRALRLIWDGYIKQGEEHNTIQVHPAQKPIALMVWCLSFLPENCTVLDPYMGSGTTGIACVRTGHNFIGIEINPKYYKLAEKRIAEAQLQMRMPLNWKDDK